MALIIRTTPPSFPLVDDPTLRQWLRIDSDVDAETLTLLLASATDYIEGLTDHVLASATYTVALSALQPVNEINLFPLNAVTSVVATLADGTTQNLTPGTDYRMTLASNRPSLSLLNTPVNTVSVLITCNAGYTNQDAVPAALQQAAAVLVAAHYDSRSALDPATTVTVTNLVARYRRVTL